MGVVFNPIRVDPDVLIKGTESGYDYISTHTYYVVVVAIDPTYIFTKFNETYNIKAFVPPKYHLGCDYAWVKVGATTQWVMGSLAYTTENLWEVCMLLKVTNLREYKLPRSPGEHPKLYLSPLLVE